jgi:hypothetical protein
MDWECAQASISGLGNAKSGAYIVKPSDLRIFYTDPTLMVSRWFCHLSTTATQANSGGFVSVGLIKWDDINDTAPASADLPGPLTNCDLDWINRFVVGVPIGTPASSYELVLDTVHISKAKRRIGSDSGILLVFENTDLTGTSGGAIDVRCLIKE